MALDAGDINATTGAAKRIVDLLVANSAACGFGSSLGGAPLSMMKAQAYCFAKGVLDEIIANGEAVIATSDSGLQRTPNPNDPDVDTAGPSVEKTLALR